MCSSIAEQKWDRSGCPANIKGGLSPQSDALFSWETDTDFCQWIGVICSHRH
uniref:Leucine-rich repeat-containing N-terminal plant-type domain-containing protein n=1 Tax=Arundo donax TaxID=35708 RepID=A0A0A9HJI5_ARUDO